MVGSYPAENSERAMRVVVERLGDRLRMLPDGETGERYRWIVHIVESLRAHPDLQVVRQGDWSDYERITRLKIRPGHQLRGDTLDFGHVVSFQESFPTFVRICDEAGLSSLDFMVGIPGDLDLALFTLGPMGAFRHRRAFTDATVNEIADIDRQAGPSVVFQLEIPVEVVFVARMPRPLRQAMAAFLARGIAELTRRSPPGTRWGIHLCVGDLGNKALGRLRSVNPLVRLANAILSRWPADHPLEYVHVPLAAGDQPAPVAEEFYRELATLRLPEDVRFIAGFAHEKATAAEHRRILRIVERCVGRQVDVAASCGLGRRTPRDAFTTMDRAAELVDGAAQ